MKSDTVKKAKKNIFSVFFNRFAVILLFLILQVALFAVTLTLLADYSIYINIFFRVISIVTIIYIVNSPGNPAFKITWLMLISFLPLFGTAVYLFIKIVPGTGRMKRRLSEAREGMKRYMEQDDKILESLSLSKPADTNLARYLANNADFPTYRNTQATYFPSGEEMFEELKLRLEEAEEYIFLEYFIVEQGTMWDTILDILTRKARQGVEVRFMYDGMCSIFQLPNHYEREVEKHGVKCRIFSPVVPILSSHQNNRDHHKICVIDGKVAFTGGVNLADEYINVKVRFGYWKDTAIMLEGDAVQTLTMLFLRMWGLYEKKNEDFGRYLTPKSAGVRRELGYVIPYGDSPLDRELIGEQVYFHIINHAKKYVHIMTPYLVLDNEMITALTHAAKCGIEVIIIMPHIPDKWYAFVLAKTYYRELLEAGVKIYEFTPGFVHAKVFTSDDDTATVGTVNLDYRSFYHHFECGVFIYNNPVVWDVEKDFQRTLKECEEETVESVQSRSLVQRMAGQVLRFIAPLM